jgi:hypothetical protein
MKKAFFLLCILIITATAAASGNVEITDGKVVIFSPDTSLEMQLFREDTDAYIDWASGTLYLDGGNISFDSNSRGNSKFYWDDANNTLIVYIVDANQLDTNDVNSITGTFSGLVTIGTLNLAGDADAGDFDWDSLDRLEFFDLGLFIDGGSDGRLLIASDGTLELASADWDISTTGVATGMGDITSDGTGTFADIAVDNISVNLNTINATTGDLYLKSADDDVEITAYDHIILDAADDIWLTADGDLDDYIRIKTISHVPTIATEGTCDLTIAPDSGNTNVTGTLGVSSHVTIAANGDLEQSGTGHVTAGSEGFIVGTLTVTDGSIDDTDGTISFGDTDVTSLDNVTMGGVFTNTMAAANTQGLDIDGDSNPFVWAGSDHYAHEITRKWAGSGTDTRPSTLEGLHTEFTWDYDHSGADGSAGGSGAVIGAGSKFVVNGIINPSYVPPVAQTWSFYGVDSITETGASADVNTTNEALNLNMYACRFFSQLTAGELNQVTGALTGNIYGGQFWANRSIATVNGNPTMNYYGGYFQATGGTEGTSTTYGGWFSGASGDTNYGVYSNAGRNVFVTSITDNTTGGSETDLYIDTGTGHIGPASSSLKYKTNIRDVDEADIAALAQLRVRKFDSIRGPGRDEIGLVAEEVAETMPRIVRYKTNLIYRDELTTGPNGEEVTTQVFDHAELTDEPDGVNYSKLIVPMLKEIQMLRAELDELKARVTELEK